ncbi:Tfp pilus assembly protein FimT/FimU [Pyxidicoccus sp. 3LFB2]
MRRHNRGITLLEVMLVVGLIGLFATVSVVGFQGMITNQRISTAQRELMLMMQEARQKARSTYQPVRLSSRTITHTDGTQVRFLRWEALPCSDTWGTTCPVAACHAAACGASGCNCPEQGPEMEVPATMDVASLVGMCWLGSANAASQVVVPTSAGANTCLAAGTAPAAGRLVVKRNTGTYAAPTWKTDLVFQVDTLTGSVRSVDCDKAPTTTGCAP